MYEKLYEKLPDTEKYLRRIGLESAQFSADLEGLDTLVHAQLTHIPFDDMDVWAEAKCPPLGISELYDKIILRRRGGYCFELNSLFCAFLKALGFDAYLVAAYVMAGREEMGPPSHCAVICTIDGAKYFCDVGYGAAVPDGAVPLDGSERLGYRIGRSGEYFDLCRVQEEFTEIRFKDTVIDPVELIPLNFFISQNPESLFRRQLHMNLRYDDGRVALVNRCLKFRRGEECFENILEIGEVPAALQEYFGILPEEIMLRDFDAEGSVI